MKKISVLIVEDKVNYRDSFKQMLGGASDFSAINMAPNAKLGLEKCRQIRPDVIICTSDLPDMPAAAFTQRVKSQYPETGLIISSFPNTPSSAQNAVAALEKGAFDIIVKPDSPISPEKLPYLRNLTLQKIRCYSIQLYSLRAQRLSNTGKPIRKSPTHASPISLKKPPLKKLSVNGSGNVPPYEIVLVGASTGGPEALSVLVQSFPRSFPIPIVMVLHMPKEFTKPMAESLNKDSNLTVKEAGHQEQILPGHAYLARGGIHLRVIKRKNCLYLQHSDTPPVNGCKPAVDVLFESAASECTLPQIAVVLTGMGKDGAKGITRLHENKNNFLIAQDKKSSIVWGMPGNAVETGFIHKQLPLHQIGPAIYEQVRKSQSDSPND